MKKIYTAGIVDDEQHGRDFVSLLLANEFPEISIVFKARNVAAAAVLLQLHCYERHSGI